jgi:pimeloyl-ACP methyl ester carboxylesterase/UDP:flavonoid glycosyltransferase YjiC (YdhE family)
VLLPPNPICHSAVWKPQVHYLARHFRVVAYDGRGNGRADSPDPAGPWLSTWRRDDCLAILDATGTERAVLVGICVNGVWPSVLIAAAQPERVHGIVALAPGVPRLAPANEWWEHVADETSHERVLADQRGFLEFFFSNMFPEPHSTKQIEDAVAWGLDTSAAVLAMGPDPAPVGATAEEVEAICRRVRCPVLVVQGDRDNCQSFESGLALADLTGGDHVRIAGAGHLPSARYPVLVNRLIHDFAARFDRSEPTRTAWVPGPARPRRAILVSSPIGLGHAWRDVAIARELRALQPDLEIHWLAQPPLTTLLEACGEIVHPASAQLASEARAVDAEAGEHELHAFEMLRRLDAIFCANFMVFLDVVRSEPFDVWIADEAWELDYFLHENPELKTAPYVWLTDFVGVLPMEAGGDREASLAADWNAQMVEHVARHPSLRDASIFIGDAEDVVSAPLGPGLPTIPDWTRDHFEFAGYVTGFGPTAFADRDALRAELGWRPDERVCVVAAGGSAVGAPLLRRAIDAYPHAKALVPELRMVVVGGPRIDVSSLRAPDGVETHGYVHELWRALAACDVAISHGGLSTTMELTAARRPFLYFPLRNHFEQNHHVAHRLDRYGSGRRLRYHDTGAEELATVLADELGRTPEPLAVDTGGAGRAAATISALL